jgi:hypothetical protein
MSKKKFNFPKKNSKKNFQKSFPKKIPKFFFKFFFSKKQSTPKLVRSQFRVGLHKFTAKSPIYI